MKTTYVEQINHCKSLNHVTTPFDGYFDALRDIEDAIDVLQKMRDNLCVNPDGSVKGTVEVNIFRGARVAHGATIACAPTGEITVAAVFRPVNTETFVAENAATETSPKTPKRRK